MISKKKHINRPLRDFKLYNRYFSIKSVRGTIYAQPKSSSTGYYPYLEYSTDLLTWNTLSSKVTINNGKKIFLRCASKNKEKVNTLSNESYINLQITGANTSSFAALSGNITSLYYGDNITKYKKTDNWRSRSLTTNIFNRLFANGYTGTTCLKYTRHLLLPNETIPENGYAYMFAGCDNLLNTPIIKAKTVNNNGMEAMFSSCTALKKPAILKVSNVGDYGMSYMFADCINLNIEYRDPFVLPYILGSNSCDSMFAGCSSLMRSPLMPADNLTSDCYYNMFYECSKLKNVVTAAQYYENSQYGNYWLEGGLLDWLDDAGSSATNPIVSFGVGIKIGSGVESGHGVPSNWGLGTEWVRGIDTAKEVLDLNIWSGIINPDYIKDYLYTPEYMHAYHAWGNSPAMV